MGNSGQNSEMGTYREIAEFWDTHSLADHWEQTEPAQFEISPAARRRYLVAIDPSLYRKLHRIAQKRKQSNVQPCDPNDMK